MTDGYISRNAAAEMLGVTPKTVTTYIQQGKLDGAYKLGHVWAIPEKAVEELAEIRPKDGFRRGRKRRITK